MKATANSFLILIIPSLILIIPSTPLLCLAFFDKKMCYSGDILRTARKLKYARHKLEDRKTGLGLP